MDNVAETKRGAIAKHFWPDYSAVVKAIDEALIKLERRGNMFLPDDCKRVRAFNCNEAPSQRCMTT